MSDFTEELRTRLDLLGAQIAERHFVRHPDQLARYGAIGHQRCREDARFHLQFLAAALDAKSDEMFLDYVAWAKVVLHARNVGEQDLHGRKPASRSSSRRSAAPIRPTSCTTSWRVSTTISSPRSGNWRAPWLS